MATPWSRFHLAQDLVSLAGLQERAGRPDDALTAAERALRMAPDDPLCLNAVAWHLASQPDPEKRDPARARTLAERALRAVKAACEPDRSNKALRTHLGHVRNTVALARVRCEDWTGAIEAAERNLAETPCEPPAADHVVLAIALAHRGGEGDAARGREQIHQARAWAEKNMPLEPGLRRLLTEASSLLAD